MKDIKMAKNNMLKNYNEVDEDFDFSEMESPYENEMISGLMSELIETSNNQMLLAMELTKLAIEKSTNSMNEDAVFSIFKKATGVIAESFPLKSLLEKLPTNN